ncbi:MAG: hypothetical protein JXB13_03765 [Phycisphaerae bacterium]|nr:hypothetical protein [Phycisphaerae bacterium]
MKRAICLPTAVLIGLTGIVAAAQAASPVEGRDAAYNYVLITTNHIATNSTRLDDYVAHKTEQGWSILVKTVESIEVEYTKALRPELFETTDERADRIKAFLKDKHAEYGIEYVILIGNPDPDDFLSASDSVGDVPMKFCYPDEHSNKFYGPTDRFYSDLTGSWDKDGDGLFGEYVGDLGAGGVTLSSPDVIVGRIPWYSSNLTGLDSIFEKIMAYEDPAADESWKWSCFMPNPIDSSDLYGREGNLSPITMAEFIKDTMLVPEGFSYYRIYEHMYDYPPMSVTPPTEMVPSPLGYTCFTRYDSSHYFKAGFNVSSGAIADYTITALTDGSNTTNWTTATMSNGQWLQFKTANSGDEGWSFAAYRVVVRGADRTALPQQFMIEMASSASFNDRYEIAVESDATAHAVNVGGYWELTYEAPGSLSTVGGKQYIRLTYTGAAAQLNVSIAEFVAYTQENKSIKPWVIPEWQNGYGVVYYNTHGSATSASDIINSSECVQLDNSKPAFIFQKACSNASPEQSNNLCATFVQYGGIAALGATRVSYGWGDWGYKIFLPMLFRDNKPFGQIMADTVADMEVHNWYGWDAYYSDSLRFNLYGDPTVRLFTDRDEDGMPYWWEERYGFDPNIANGDDDPDFDSLTNYDEYVLGTDPTNPDTDGDGVNDAVDECQNTPAGWPVDVRGCLIGDFGRDGDVDEEDYTTFESCLTGPGGPTGIVCGVDADFDDDGDVDLGDFCLFQPAYGAGLTK